MYGEDPLRRPPASTRGDSLERRGTHVAKIFVYLVRADLLYYLGVGKCTAHVAKGAAVSKLIPKRFAQGPARWDTDASKYFKEDESRTEFIDI